ncbi:MAG: RCC1 domain-containing protein [Gemmatimonadales bacterium]
MKALLTRIPLFIASIAIAGCASSDQPTGSGHPATTATLILTELLPIPEDVVGAGQIYTVGFKAFDSLEIQIPGVVPDSMVNRFPDIAALSHDTVRMLKPGMAEIVTWYQGLSHDMGWTVAQPTVAIRILADTLSVDSVRLVAGGSLHLIGEVTLADDSGPAVLRSLHFASSDTTLLTIVGEQSVAELTGVTSGKAVVTASREGVSATLVVDLSPSRYAQISAGAGHTCALDPSGAAWCWGANGSGQLSRLLAYTGETPAPINSALRFHSITVGGLHTCALTGSGVAYCWGDNTNGQLGDGATQSSPIPVAVGDGHQFTFIEAGQQSTCGIDGAGDAWCWGLNAEGELGTGTAGSGTPQLVAGGHHFLTLATSVVESESMHRHSCGVDDQNVAWCWGANNSGQLGDSSIVDVTVRGVASTIPVRVRTDSLFRSVAVTGDGSCGITVGGNVMCWGESGVGAFLNQDFTAVPVLQPGLAGTVSLDAGATHYCAATATGAGFCFGGTSGAADGGGPGGLAGRQLIAVVGGHQFSAMSVGDGFSCGIATDGVTWCWGDNNSGELGWVTPGGSNTPGAVMGQ